MSFGQGLGDSRRDGPVCLERFISEGANRKVQMKLYTLFKSHLVHHDSLFPDDYGMGCLQVFGAVQCSLSHRSRTSVLYGVPQLFRSVRPLYLGFKIYIVFYNGVSS